jgi:hypothetical protein
MAKVSRFSTFVCLKTEQDNISYTFVVPFESNDLCSLLDTSRALVFLVGSTSGCAKDNSYEIFTLFFVFHE